MTTLFESSKFSGGSGGDYEDNMNKSGKAGGAHAATTGGNGDQQYEAKKRPPWFSVEVRPLKRYKYFMSMGPPDKTWSFFAWSPQTAEYLKAHFFGPMFFRFLAGADRREPL